MSRRSPIAWILGLALAAPASAQGPKPVDPPTAATPVAIDFKARPVAQVVRALAERTGGMVDTFNTNDARWDELRVTLDDARPVPFWEAIDRLSAAADLRWSATPAGNFGVPRPRVQFEFPVVFGAAPPISADDDGLVAYVGPFRVGPVVVHEHFVRAFPPVRSPVPGPIEAPSPAFHADIPLLAEPDLIAVQVGPPRKVEAIDDAGQSLLDAKLVGEVPFIDFHASTQRLRLPLARAPRPSRALATLRAALPLEVARRPTTPALVVPLDGSAGKTYRAGDVAIVVREYRVDPQGSAYLRLVLRLEGPRGRVDPAFPRAADARLGAIAYHLIDLADPRSNPVASGGGVSGVAGIGGRELSMNYNIPPADAQGRRATHLRVYRPDWVDWDLPIEFRDAPLP